MSSHEFPPVPTAPSAPLRVQTLGRFRLWRDGEEVPSAAWRREKALHLFQFLVTTRLRAIKLHKEQIIDRLWPTASPAEGDRDFKVALHTIHKILEPQRKARADPRFVQRQDLTYGLNLDTVWIDALAFEELVIQANKVLLNAPETAQDFYQKALNLYQGDYLPERWYEDWSSAERERLQVLALGVMTTLADLVCPHTPLESIRLTQHALALDSLWENAYRIQIEAYLALGNRPLALRTYQQCQQTLETELGLAPLPETQALYKKIRNKK